MLFRSDALADEVVVRIHDDGLFVEFGGVLSGQVHGKEQRGCEECLVHMFSVINKKFFDLAFEPHPVSSLRSSPPLSTEWRGEQPNEISNCSTANPITTAHCILPTANWFSPPPLHEVERGAQARSAWAG